MVERHPHTTGDITGLAAVAKTGSYDDLDDQPTIPVVSIVPKDTSSDGYPDGLFIEYEA